MIAVIFEVWPESGKAEDYLAIAADLRPLLDTIDGFISIERFTSISDPTKFLSLSFWRDEESILAWKNVVSHLAAQKLGRERWYEQYKVRIARVERAYDFHASKGDALAEHVD